VNLKSDALQSFENMNLLQVSHFKIVFSFLKWQGSKDKVDAFVTTYHLCWMKIKITKSACHQTESPGETSGIEMRASNSLGCHFSLTWNVLPGLQPAKR
jgi:hypothetical protein